MIQQFRQFTESLVAVSHTVTGLFVRKKNKKVNIYLQSIVGNKTCKSFDSDEAALVYSLWTTLYYS